LVKYSSQPEQQKNKVLPSMTTLGLHSLTSNVTPLTGQ
jgi:hypothetical protein